LRARPVATRRFAPRSRPSPLNYTDPSGFSAETNEDIATGVGAGYFTGLAVHLLTSGGTAASAGAASASAASAGADAVAAGAGAASAAPALAAAGAGAGFATSFAMNVVASGRQPTSSVVSAPPSTRSATAGGAGTPPLGRSAYSTMAISPVQEGAGLLQNKGGIQGLALSGSRPPGTSLFDPERGALAQNYGNPFVQCDDGGDCHHQIPLLIPEGDLERAGAAISNWVTRAFDGLRNLLRPTQVSARPDVTLSGGRSGQFVKNLKGPPNSAVRGGGDRAFVTNDNGEVILDITRDRVKPVTPGQGFGPKRAPTDDELDLLDKVLK